MRIGGGHRHQVGASGHQTDDQEYQDHAEPLYSHLSDLVSRRELVKISWSLSPKWEMRKRNADCRIWEWRKLRNAYGGIGRLAAFTSNHSRSECTAHLLRINQPLRLMPVHFRRSTNPIPHFAIRNPQFPQCCYIAPLTFYYDSARRDRLFVNYWLGGRRVGA